MEHARGEALKPADTLEFAAVDAAFYDSNLVYEDVYYDPQTGEFDTDEYQEAEFDTGGQQAVSSPEAALGSFGAGGELTVQEKTILLNPNADNSEKLATAMQIHRGSNGDFRQYAENGVEEEFRVTGDQLWTRSAVSPPRDEYDRLPSQRLILAATSYAAKQQDIEDTFTDSGFNAFVDDPTWQELQQAPIEQRSRMTGKLFDQYQGYKDETDALLGNEVLIAWISAKGLADMEELATLPVKRQYELLETLNGNHQVEQAEAERQAAKEAAEEAAKKAAQTEALNEEQERQTQAHEQVDQLFADDPVLSDWLQSAKKPTFLNKLETLSYTDLLSVLKGQQNSKVYKKHLTKALKAEEARQVEQDNSAAVPVSEKVSARTGTEPPGGKLPGVAFARTSDERRIGWKVEFGVQRPSVTASEGTQAVRDATQDVQLTVNRAAISAADALANVDPVKQATVIAAAAAMVGGNSIGDLVSKPPGDKALTEAFDEMEKVSLAPGAPNPAAEVPDATQVAQTRYSVEPEQTIPGELRMKVIGAGITSARTKVRTISANPDLKDSEPDETKLDRSDEDVREIDELARSTLVRMRDEADLTPEQVTTASEGIVKVMMAARFPKSVSEIADGFEPQNTLQRQIANRVGSTVLAGNTAYSNPKEKDLIGALMGKAVDDMASEGEQAQVVDHFEKKGKEIAGLEASVVNPTFTLGQYLAGVSITESGSPARNVTNQYGYVGPWQMSPEYWSKPDVGWAATYLGDAKAKMTIDNQVMVAVKLWTHNMESQGSGRAGMATWLKGPATGGAIAGRDMDAYNAALTKRDGNGTSVLGYMKGIESDVKGMDNVSDIHKQLPFLKGVIERNGGFDWKLLEKKHALYPSLHMDKLVAAAERRADERARAAELSEERQIAGRKIVAIAEREFKKNGNKRLETQGPNTGPEVQKYTGGPSGANAPWCMWFVSYLYREAGYEFKGSPAGADGNIPSVENMSIWFQNNGILFKPGDKGISPQPGDVIMYNGGEHGGVVTKVRGTMIETIEGNTSGDGSYDADGGTVGRKVFDYTTSPKKIELGRLRNP